MNNWLYIGQVAHKRIGLAAHQFSYPTLFMCFPLSARPQLARAGFGYNRFNLLSFYEQDHGNGQDAEQWIKQILADKNLDQIANGEIWLQSQPRVLGYVFNPVSFWYCYDQQQQLRVILCEVNNTFGERHCYLLTASHHQAIDNHTTLNCEKIFHVSPFFAVEGEYQFRFVHRQNTRTVAINYFVNQQLTLKTVVTGQAQDLSLSNICQQLAKLGWTTVLVVARIHWQALKLWRKGAIFHRKPLPPQMEISS